MIFMFMCYVSVILSTDCFSCVAAMCFYAFMTQNISWFWKTGGQLKCYYIGVCVCVCTSWRFFFFCTQQTPLVVNNWCYSSCNQVHLCHYLRPPLLTGPLLFKLLIKYSYVRPRGQRRALRQQVGLLRPAEIWLAADKGRGATEEDDWATAEFQRLSFSSSLFFSPPVEESNIKQEPRPKKEEVRGRGQPP